MEEEIPGMNETSQRPIPLMGWEIEAQGWNRPCRARGLEPTDYRASSGCQQLSLAGARNGAEVEEDSAGWKERWGERTTARSLMMKDKQAVYMCDCGKAKEDFKLSIRAFGRSWLRVKSQVGKELCIPRPCPVYVLPPHPPHTAAMLV